MTPDDRQRLYESIKHHEGYRSKAYKDTLGHWTIGYGTNLETLEIELATANAWMHKALNGVEADLNLIEGWSTLNGVRQATLIEMAYQLGVAGCKKFVKMWAAIADKDWPRAAREMGNSRWAEQTSKRVAELQSRMLWGTWDGRRPE
jgi:lysozyme